MGFRAPTPSSFVKITSPELEVDVGDKDWSCEIEMTPIGATQPGPWEL